MANEAIITPGYNTVSDVPEETLPTEQYLKIDERLRELSSEHDSAVARANLGVPSQQEFSEIANKVENLDSKISEKASTAVNQHLNEEDPHGTWAKASEEFSKYIKKDGSTKFTSPQSGVDPTRDEHLTTRGYVKSLLEEYKKDNNPNKLLPEVKQLLEDYLQNAEKTSRNLDSQLKSEINKDLAKVARVDVTNYFSKPQIGAYQPTSDIHLSNKKYVDDKVWQHLVSVDPHGYIAMLNQRLAKYAKIDEVLPATETYSKTQIDNEISKIVEDITSRALQDYKDSVNTRFDNVRKEHYVKQDGSISFKNPQSGVDATEDSHLVTLRQLNQLTSQLYTELSNKIKEESCYWITSGAVETTVGFLEDNSTVPDKMSIQEVLDSIFYGKKVSITAPETGTVGQKVDVVVCITGDLSTVDLAQLYQDDVLIRTIQREEFEENGCVTVQSESIEGDTVFRLDVYYSNDAKHSEYAKTKLAYPIFIGVYNEWYPGSYMVYEDLVEWSKKDPVNNKFYDRESHLRELEHQFNFDEEKPVRIILAMPASYPSLQSMNNDTQKLGPNAFTKMNSPFTVTGDEKATDYKIYLYKQGLTRLDSKVTFKF